MDKDYVSFLGTNEEFGGLSNMAGGYAVMINGTCILTSEHLYQALKFPDHPGIQKEILHHPSPMRAKMVTRSRLNKPLVRPDWESIQLDVMAYCLRVKLVWNWVRFGHLLESTGDLDIFEISSKKDRFWGVTQGTEGFEGQNHLGRLLTELRNQYLDVENESLRFVEAPKNLQLRFLGKEIDPIDRRSHLLNRGTRTSGYVNQFRL